MSSRPWCIAPTSSEDTRRKRSSTSSADPSPWSVTDRELFAAYTSRLNQCPFCTGQHGAVASARLGKDMIEAVYADRTTAPVSAEVKAALALIETFTLRPDEL